MRLAAILPSALDGQSDNPSVRDLSVVEIDGMEITCASVTAPDPEFDPCSRQHQQCVLVRVKAFSCNYRDKALMLLANMNLKTNGFYCFGSEFAGEVVDLGSHVRSFAAGDRVIGNNAYSGKSLFADENGASEGIPTNHASKEFQVVKEHQLIRIPDNMPFEVGAAFSLAAQTAYSMIRKLQLHDSDSVLVTSAKSCTSLITISALRNHDAETYAASSTTAYASELRSMGVRELFCIDPGWASFDQHPELAQLARAIKGFNCVIDPFFDLNLPRLISSMAPGGRYVSCGFLQLAGGSLRPSAENAYLLALATAITKNIRLSMNCLGETSDLQRALIDYEQGRLEIPIDRVFSNAGLGAFLDRTFNSKERFGKVIFSYH